jgi:hypothetical protein
MGVSVDASKFVFQDLQDAVGTHVLIDPGSDLHHGPAGTVAEAMHAFEDHIPLQLVILQVILYHLQRGAVSPAEAGRAHANLDFFSGKCHAMCVLPKVIKCPVYLLI